jgi:hypothetical protein
VYLFIGGFVFASLYGAGAFDSPDADTTRPAEGTSTPWPDRTVTTPTRTIGHGTPIAGTPAAIPLEFAPSPTPTRCSDEVEVEVPTIPGPANTPQSSSTDSGATTATPEPDSDKDGLSDRQEEICGTDPHDPDTDGDGLLDSWEVRNEGFVEWPFTNPERPLPNADPLRKDIYVVPIYSAEVPRLSDEELRAFQYYWGDMRVANPDNSTGITFHLLRDQAVRLNESAIEDRWLSGDEARQLVTDYADPHIERPHCDYRYAFFYELPPSQDSYGTHGLADSGGHVSFVVGNGSFYDPTVASTTRVEILTHELLHNIVGQLSPDAPNVVDGGTHTIRGWLSKYLGSRGRVGRRSASRLLISWILTDSKPSIVATTMRARTARRTIDQQFDPQ